MKLPIWLLLLTIVFQITPFMPGAYAKTPGKTIQSQPYLDNCETALAVFENHKDQTVEEKFVALADTPEKMLQLVFDYHLLFSRAFADAMFSQLALEGVIAEGTAHDHFDRLLLFSRRSPEELTTFLWKTLELNRDMTTKAKSDSAGQIRFTQLKNLIEAIKASPNRKLFEDIALQSIQASLIGHAQTFVGNYRWRVDASARINKISGRVGWATFGLVALGGLYLNFLPGMTDTPLPAVFGFGAGSFGGVILSFIVRDSMRDGGVRSAAQHPVDIFIRTSPGSAINVASDSILSFLKTESDHGVLSVQEGCKVDVCQLTPVQIAYLGHVDILNLEALQKSLKEAMGIQSGGEVSKLADAARSVHDDPGNYTKQMLLNRALTSFLEKTSTLSSAREAAAAALTNYFTAVTKHTRFLLNEKPYKEKPLTDEGIFKNHLLLNRIQADLAHVEKMRLDTKAIEVKLQNSERMIEKLKLLLRSLPKGPSGWKEAAEEIILNLDELK